MQGETQRHASSTALCQAMKGMRVGRRGVGSGWRKSDRRAGEGQVRNQSFRPLSSRLRPGVDRLRHKPWAMVLASCVPCPSCLKVSELMPP